MRHNKFNIIIIIALLLLLPIIVAQEDLTITPTDTEANTEIEEEPDIPTTETKEDLENTSTQFPSDPKQGAKEVLTAAQQAAREGVQTSTSTIKTKVESLNLPSVLATPTRIIFKIEKGVEISLEKFVVLISLFFGFLVLIKGATDFFPLKEEWHSLVVALGITAIISITGVLNTFSVFLFDFGLGLKFLESIGPIRIIIGVIIALIIFYVFLRVEKFVFRKFKLDSARHKGEKVDEFVEMAKTAVKSTN